MRRSANSRSELLRSTRLSARLSCAIHTLPMPKPVCRTSSNNKWVQYEVRRASLGRGRGMNVTAQRRPRRDPADPGVSPSKTLRAHCARRNRYVRTTYGSYDSIGEPPMGYIPVLTEAPGAASEGPRFHLKSHKVI